ncbi:MAG: hypothetical protein IJW34_09115 [Clostridia bacterium]|nr:hypothetical protein [Clostridia bacterium]
MDFFTAFLLTFSSLLVSETLLARLAGGAVCLLFGFFVRFFGGRPSVWIAPLLLASCFLRTFPLWGFFTGELGDPRGAILFFLAWLSLFFLAANKKDAPPSLLVKRCAVPFSLFVMVFCLFWIREMELSFGEADLPGVLICALSGMLVLPKSESLPQTYCGIGLGILLSLFPIGLGRGLLLALLSPLVAASELCMVCAGTAYTLPKKKRPRKD